MLDPYVKDKISDVNHSLCIGLKARGGEMVSVVGSDSMRAGFAIHMSSVRCQQRRQQKQKQLSHL